MTSLKKSIAHLSSELQLFAPQISAELQELRRNVEVRPVTGATLYRHCLEDLDDRVSSLGDDIASLEAVSLDAISLEELVGHCTTLYQANHNAISALEARLQSYGYRQSFSPTPPKNPQDMLLLDQLSPSGAAALPSEGDASDELSPPIIPPSLSRYAARGGGCTAAEALAPMTAAKARARNDTPSSMSSPEVFSPSMRHLLGKYAGSGSTSGGALSASLSARKGANVVGAGGTAASPLPPLSPAFAAAAHEQRAQLDLYVSTATAAPELSQGETPQQEQFNNEDAELRAADSFIASTARKLAANPELVDSYRAKYPYVAASAERLVNNGGGGGGGGGGAVAPAYYEEESTMELKSQVIFNRALATQQTQQQQQGNHYTASTPSVGAVQGYGMTPSTATLMNRALGGGAGSQAAVDPSPAISVPPSSRSKESLQDAIAAALGRSHHPNNTAATAAVAAAPTPAAATPAAPPLSARTLPSARSSLTPSLPTAVPPYTEVAPSEYSSLPAFIRGQLPLDVLNEAASAVHAVAVSRCAAGEGPSFSMDDVEAAGSLPAGKGKVLVNALAKLGRVQLKVLYGQGTVYFFACS